MQVVQERLDARTEEDAASQLQGAAFQAGPLHDVSQRQVGDEPLLFGKPNQSVQRLGVKGQVGETVHHAFGRAGGAGGVDDGRQVVRRPNGKAGHRGVG